MIYKKMKIFESPNSVVSGEGIENYKAKVFDKELFDTFNILGEEFYLRKDLDKIVSSQYFDIDFEVNS